MGDFSYAQEHPRVFISYSRDSAAHIKQVLALANQLRSEGVDCVVDEYESAPIQGWPKWMMDEIAAACFVLVICSPGYAAKFARDVEPGVGLGVAWEGAIVTQDLYRAAGYNAKYLPVVLSADALACIPQSLSSTTFYDLSREDGYERLYRRLTNQPEIVKPPLGSIRSMAPRPVTSIAARTGASQLGGPELVNTLIQSGWSNEVLESRWPHPEQAYTQGSESPNFKEVAYDGGSFRGFFNSTRSEVLAIAFENSHPAYPQVATMQSSDLYTMYKDASFIFVCRANRVSELVYEHLSKTKHTLAQITDLLGQPSYREHVHGIGDWLFVFIPQGLMFKGSDKQVELWRPRQERKQIPPTYEQYLVHFQTAGEDFCRLRSAHMTYLRQAVNAGKVSPGGTYRAGVLKGVVYWENYVVITQEGKAEIRVHAPHFIGDCNWLDNERVVFTVKDAVDTAFYTASVSEHSLTFLSTVKGYVLDFSVANPRLILYRDVHGQVIQLDV